MGKDRIRRELIKRIKFASYLLDDYVCNRCGRKMEFEDEWRDILVCPYCGHSVGIENYGMDMDEDWDEIWHTNDGYPSEDEI